MRGGSFRVFLLASIVVHGTVITLLPRDPLARGGRGDAPLASTGTVSLDAIPTWQGDPAGRARALASWAEALTVARAPMDVSPPGGASRTDSALDLGTWGTGPGTSRESETRLADRDDRIALSENVPNSLREDQVQRIDTGEVRSTWDDRRATPNPAYDDLVASPRRPDDARVRSTSQSDPARGVETEVLIAPGGAPEVAVAATIGIPGDGGEEPLAPREAVLASEVPPGGEEALAPGREGADVDGASAGDRVAAFQRPDISDGSASVPAPVHDTRTRDDRTGRFWNAHFYRSYTDASAVSGQTDAGSGDGNRGDGRGLSGRGPGARGDGADARGPRWISFRTGDPRYLSYFRQIHRKIDPLWREAFPESLRLSHDQGMVIVGFVLHRNGTVSGVRILRQSGWADFDANVVAAVRRAAPFLPIPSEIVDDVLHVSAPFHFSNPMF